MDITVYNKAGKAGEKVAISDKLLGAKPNKDLIYQVATTQMANGRQILAHTKTRSEVRGGGKKPWRQKGTGRARHGSIRSPIWVGGGVSHGPTKEVNFKKKVNRTQARAAMLAVLSSRVTDGHMLVVDTLGLEKGKTKEAAALFATLASKGFKKYRAGERILLVLSGATDDMPIRRSTANIQHIDTIRAQDLNALTVLSYPFVIATKDAVEVMEKTFITAK